MGYYQNGQPLPWREVQLIAAFLRTLTGELDGVRLVDSIPLPPQVNLGNSIRIRAGCASVWGLLRFLPQRCRLLVGWLWRWIRRPSLSTLRPRRILDAARTPDHPVMLTALETHELDAVATFLWEESGKSGFRWAVSTGRSPMR